MVLLATTKITIIHHDNEVKINDNVGKEMYFV